MNVVTSPLKVGVGYGTNTLQPGRAETVEKKPEKEPEKKWCHIVNEKDRRFYLCGAKPEGGYAIPPGSPGCLTHLTAECAGRGCNRCPECGRIYALIASHG